MDGVHGDEVVVTDSAKCKVALSQLWLSTTMCLFLLSGKVDRARLRKEWCQRQKFDVIVAGDWEFYEVPYIQLRMAPVLEVLKI
uniref:Uncharacterized protein n=1 Tax=Oryza meridionalis TaxID=40149 RepID=A0A0E0DFV8_9ORYZ